MNNKTPLDIDIIRIKQILELKTNNQRKNFREQILRGQKTDNLTYKKIKILRYLV